MTACQKLELECPLQLMADLTQIGFCDLEEILARLSELLDEEFDKFVLDQLSDRGAPDFETVCSESEMMGSWDLEKISNEYSLAVQNDFFNLGFGKR